MLQGITLTGVQLSDLYFNFEHPHREDFVTALVTDFQHRI